MQLKQVFLNYFCKSISSDFILFLVLMRVRVSGSHSPSYQCGVYAFQLPYSARLPDVPAPSLPQCHRPYMYSGVLKPHTPVHNTGPGEGEGGAGVMWGRSRVHSRSMDQLQMSVADYSVLLIYLFIHCT